MREKLNLLLEKHCVTIKQNVELVGEYLKRAGAADAATPGQALKDAAALTHQLKGSGGTAGFHDISGAATALNDHLNAITRGEVPFRQGVDKAMALFEPLGRAAREATPQSSALYLAMS